MVKEPRATICYYDSGSLIHIVLYNCIDIFELLAIFEPTDGIDKIEFSFQKGKLENYQFFPSSDFNNIYTILDLIMITEAIGPELEVHSLEAVLNNEVEFYIDEGEVSIVFKNELKQEASETIRYILENICRFNISKSQYLFDQIIKNNKRIIEFDTSGYLMNIYNSPREAGFHWDWQE